MVVAALVIIAQHSRFKKREAAWKEEIERLSQYKTQMQMKQIGTADLHHTHK
ncbi:MAG: hypothetical protein JWM16_5216 [Verrucomicrobiales bacterium]|nr:hypothetical protein [Verrucomicrobiales bacterium]